MFLKDKIKIPNLYIFILIIFGNCDCIICIIHQIERLTLLIICIDCNQINEVHKKLTEGIY